MNIACYFCGTSIPGELARNRSTLCSSCGRDVRVCLNCRFYSPGDHWDCRENISELVRDKDRANFCDWFSPKPGEGGKPEASGEGPTSSKKAFEDLFG